MLKNVIRKVIGSKFLIVAFLLFACIYVYWFTQKTETNMQNEQLLKAKIIASAINLERLEKLCAHPEDENQTDYLRIKYQLKYARLSTPDCKFIYLLKPIEKGEIAFLVDSQDKGTPDYAHPGMIYEEIPNSYMPAFVNKTELSVGPIEDRWGVLFTALIPIKNPNTKKLIAVLGMDYDAKNWNYILFKKTLPIGLSAIIFLIALSIMVYSTRRLNKTVKRRTKQLQETKESYRTTLYSIGDAVISTNEEGYIENMNPIAEKLTAWSYEEAKRKKLSEVFNIINSQTGKIADNPADKVLKTGKIIGLANHTALIDKNGKQYQISDSGAPIIDEAGNISGVVLVFRDETEKYFKEKQLEESEEKFRNLAETASVSIFVHLNDKWAYSNKAGEQLTGYNLQELKLMDFWEIVSPEYQSIVKERGIKRQNREDAIARYEIKIITKYQEEKWAVINAAPIKFEGKDAVLVSALDITEQKHNEREAKISKERYKALFEQAADGILIGIADGTIIDANEHIATISGYPKDELIGSNISILFTKEELDAKPLRYDSVFEGKTVLKQRKLIRKDKSIILIEMKTSIVGDGRIQAFVRDITKRANIEKLKREKELAEKSSQMKQHFLANMSHDMRTPLTGIIGFTDLLLESQLIDDQVDYTKHIKESSEYLLNLVNDLLDISKIEEGRVKLLNEIFDAKKLINKQVDFYKEKAFEKGIELSYSIDEHYPQFVVGDRFRFRQIITNLLSNAVKYTEKGNIQLDLEKTRELGDKIEGKISVEDTGIGISKENIDQIFDVFSRVDNSTTKKTEGTGLGLSITKKLAQMMDGDIGVQSNPNQGSKFWVTFTFKTAESNKKSKVESLNKYPNETINILVVEDKRVNQMLLKLILEKEGFNVKIANNGLEALEMYQKEHFQLIFMDIMMPVMDGITAINELQKRHTDLPPIIGLSAHAQEENANYYKNIGMDDFLEKPINRNRLIEKVFHWSKNRN